MEPLPGRHQTVATKGERQSDALSLPELDAATSIPPLSPTGRLRSNNMLRNSLYLLLSSGLQAVLGLAFWILAARLFSATDVGRATSLISVTTLIAFVGLLGLNSSLVRYLPTAQHRDAMVTTAILVVAIYGGLLALIYALVVPVVAPRVTFLENRPLFVLGFVVLTGAGAVNLLTDAVFIAARRAGLNVLVDGGVGGIAKLLLVPVLAGSGAYGLFCASTGGFAASALASVILIWLRLGYRPRLKGALESMRPLLRFSVANYLGNIFNLVPTLVVPLIVLDRLGASAAGYYYVSFQVANLLYAGAYAVEQNFLAEGAHGEEELRPLMWRAAKLLAVFSVPAAIVVALSAHLLLTVFGGGYAKNASEALVLMACAAIPVAAQNWLLTVLRLSGQLVAITLSNIVYAAGICTLAWFLVPHGLKMVGAAWLLGALGGVAAGTVAVLLGAKRRAVQQ